MLRLIDVCDVDYDVYMKWDMIWYSVMKFDITYCDELWCDEMRYDMIWCDVMWCDLIQCSMMSCDVIRCDRWMVYQQIKDDEKQRKENEQWQMKTYVCICE